MDAVRSNEETKQDKLQAGERSVGSNEESRGRARREYAVEEVFKEGCHIV